MTREEVFEKMNKAKSIENEFLKMASEEKFLNEFISKIICSYLLARFDCGELKVLAETFFADMIEDGVIKEEELIPELFGNIAVAVDDVPLDEVIAELEAHSELKDSWKI